MVAKKSSSTKKKASTTKKTVAKKTKVATPSIEQAVEKGVEQGIENTVNRVLSKHRKSKQHSCSTQHTGGFIWFTGFVGAAVYYISTATGFWNGLWGVVKALVWPAIVVFKLLAGL